MLFRLHALDDLQVQRAICERKTEKRDFAVFPGVVKPPVKLSKPPVSRFLKRGMKKYFRGLIMRFFWPDGKLIGAWRRSKPQSANIN